VNAELSIVICTYNRAPLLERALASIYHQDFGKDYFEVLVVDNNSTDNTLEVVQTFQQQVANLLYFKEMKQGLSNARNRGWQEAHADYVGFLDDDGKASDRWIETALEIIHNIHPAVFGGPYYPYYDTTHPRWFRDEYASHELGKAAHMVKPGEYLSGGNLFFRKDLLEKMGGFDPRLGMSGQAISYGEETRLLIQIAESYPEEEIVYDPGLFIYHLVQPYKMTWGWIIRSRFASGRASYRIQSRSYTPISWIMDLAYQLLALPADVAFGMFLRDRTKYPYLQNFIYERGMKHIWSLGMLYEKLIATK
jgi:glucosyl-dolichyl phosphate glucuronosyltransferase